MIQRGTSSGCFGEKIIEEPFWVRSSRAPYGLYADYFLCTCGKNWFVLLSVRICLPPPPRFFPDIHLVCTCGCATENEIRIQNIDGRRQNHQKTQIFLQIERIIVVESLGFEEELGRTISWFSYREGSEPKKGHHGGSLFNVALGIEAFLALLFASQDCFLDSSCARQPLDDVIMGGETLLVLE